jgi:hypothetical protein
LFSGVQVKPECRLRTCLRTPIGPLAANSARLFSSARDRLVEQQAIVTSVKVGMDKLKFVDKAVIDHTSKLKDGRQVQVRRLGVQDAQLVSDYYADAGPWSMFDSLASTANKVSNIKAILFNAAAIGSDALVAIVDAKMVGLIEYEAEVGEMEHPIDSAMLRRSGLDASDVCVSKTMIVREARDRGVGTALKRAQMHSAKSAGYKAIVSLSSNPAMLHIVAKMGGAISNQELGAVWSLIALDLNPEPLVSSAVSGACLDPVADMLNTKF